MPKIVLASQSTSRRRLLEGAGINPTIIVSNVDEETDFFNAMSPADMVIALAVTKAHTVREQIDYPALIIGCDSTFDVDGVSFGKPGTPDIARERAKKISGRSGLLHTGHCIIDTAQGREIADRVTTKVTFSELTDHEIEDYIASGEPLQVAGGFTLDGFGSPFIPVIEGDYTNVVGLSMPFLRSAMSQLGYSWPEVKEMR
ncbi:Maf Nucleotide-binding protein implicated in inhibition of septum formation [Candidatus Nanopelagicaceae bacterium]|jgi:septum formation protein|uniref:Maf family protein n=1 Tax=Candidatus Planktophila lacus TaxID=1884913 RepID=UPI000BACE2F7|nr:nucleoside triphosphate pyrophosphatase [Candidatus Planktophila lacus]ASY29366.1 septum formation protein [Candidatus Planktophila lacus]MCX6441813.1 Maf family protein [Actinomycetota bacterium]